MITIVTLRFCINLEKTHQILNNNYNYENISYLEYINTIIIMRDGNNDDDNASDYNSACGIFSDGKGFQTGFRFKELLIDTVTTLFQCKILVVCVL